MKSNAQFWDNIAATYSAKPVEDPDAFERKIEVTQSKLRPTDTVLEVGCGTGSLALRLASSVAEIHGLDVSSEMIRIAEAKIEQGSVKNVHFTVGAFDERLDTFAPESLDAVLAFSILHLLEDREAALNRMWHLLRPGGLFVSSTVCLGGSWVPYSALLWTMRQLGKAPWVGVIDRQHLLDDIARAGFDGIETPDVGAKSTVAFVTARRPNRTNDDG